MTDSNTIQKIEALFLTAKINKIKNPKNLEIQRDIRTTVKQLIEEFESQNIYLKDEVQDTNQVIRFSIEYSEFLDQKFKKLSNHSL